MKRKRVDGPAVMGMVNQCMALAIGCCLVGLMSYRYGASCIETQSGPEAVPPVAIEASVGGGESKILFFPAEPSIRDVLIACGVDDSIVKVLQGEGSASVASGTHISVSLGVEPALQCKPMAAGKRMCLGIPLYIHTATAEDLTLISGVGPGMAHDIIEYRNSIGSFSEIEQLKNVRGIGEKRFHRIQKYVSINRE